MGLNLLTILADASSVNGGAIDGFLRPLMLHYAVVQLVGGLLCAQLSRRHAQAALLAFFAALTVCMALKALGISVVVPSTALLVVSGVLIVTAVVVRWLPHVLGGSIAIILLAILGILIANTFTADLGFKSPIYQISFLAASATASLGLLWSGFAIGLIALRTTSDMLPDADEAPHPAIRLVAVLGLTFWVAGFVDLVTHTSNPPTLLGRYSIPFALLLMVYTAGFLFWLNVALRAQGRHQLQYTIQFIQQRTWLSLGVFGMCIALIGSMFLVKGWANLPLFELAMLGTCLLIMSALLLVRIDRSTQTSAWRKAILTGGFTFLAAEALLQGAAALGILPIENMSGVFTAYGRVYQNHEGLGSGTTNRYGWYAADPQQGRPGHVILFTGDSFVQGLQVTPEQNMSAVMQAKLRQSGRDQDEATYVYPLGFPGYTAALYTDPKLAPYTMLQFNPTEVVVFFHLADDLQATNEPTWQYPFYTLNSDGTLVRRNEDTGLRHALQHLIIRAYDPVNPVQSIQSHLFSVQILKRLIGYKYEYRAYGDQGVPPQAARNTDFVTAEQPFGRSTFAFVSKESAQSKIAFGIAHAQLKEFSEELAALGIAVKLVSIPYYPQAFFEQRNAGWSSRIGDFDALLPEAELGQIARELNIPYLPMGEYMQRQGTSVDQIKSLYFNDGRGHFTPVGHAYFAQAVQDCFYTETSACPIEIANSQ
jgi:hypothetical protein